MLRGQPYDRIVECLRLQAFWFVLCNQYGQTRGSGNYCKKIENKLIGKPPFRGDVSGFYAGTLVV